MNAVQTKRTSRHRAGGSRSLTYEEGFDATLRMDDAMERVDAAVTDRERRKWQREADRLGNKITPPARQAASETHRAVVEEARRWIVAHGGMPNMADFIAHIQALPASSRQYKTADKPIVLTSKAIRAILRKYLGIVGVPGRQKKAT